MFSVIPKQIFNKVYEVLQDSSLSYFKTNQKGFTPKQENLLAPTQYPWIFIEFGGITPPEVYRTLIFSYEFTVNVIAMTLADRGEITDLIFTDSLNANKGIGDINADLGALFWGYKKSGFGIDGIIDWTIGRVGTPNVLHIQPLLASPYVRGIQMDLVFKCQERLSV